MAPGVVLDFEQAGRLVGIDIAKASRAVSLTTLEALKLPLRAITVGVAARHDVRVGPPGIPAQLRAAAPLLSRLPCGRSPPDATAGSPRGRTGPSSP